MANARGGHNTSFSRGEHDAAIFRLAAQDIAPDEIAGRLGLDPVAVKRRISLILEVWPEPDDAIRPFFPWHKR